MNALIAARRAGLFAALALLLLALPAWAATTTNIVDSAGDAGFRSSLVLNASGLPVISYSEATSSDLRLAVCADATCSSGTSITTVSVGGGGGWFPSSLALSASGFPVIAYASAGLKLAVCADATCSSGSTITTTTIDPNAVVSDLSLKLNPSGFPVISYDDNGDLKVAVCADATCSANTTVTNIDPSPAISGEYTSLALNASGFPVISYYDETNRDLKLAVCADATCSSDTTITAIDPNAFLSPYTSLALNARGFPVISYDDYKTGDLKLAICADTTCSSGTTITTVDGASPGTGAGSSLKLPASGFPVISYYYYDAADASAGNLKVAVCANATCSGGTTFLSDSTAGDDGDNTSLALNTSGFPVVSYYGDVNKDLLLTLIDSFPEIAVLGSSLEIASGDTTPALADQTSFGRVAVGDLLTHTFTISNSGSVDLVLSGSPRVAISGPAEADFSLVAGGPSTPVAPNSTVSFTLRFTPTAGGLRSATVSIQSNDMNEGLYTFTVQGIGGDRIYLPLVQK